MSRVGSAYIARSCRFDLSDGLRRVGRPALLDHRIVRPEIPQVVRGDGVNRLGDRERLAGVSRYLIAVGGQQLRQLVGAVHVSGAFPGQMIEPDVIQRDGVGADAEQRCEQALVTDGDVAQPDRAVAGVQQRPGDDSEDEVAPRTTCAWITRCSKASACAAMRGRCCRAAR